MKKNIFLTGYVLWLGALLIPAIAADTNSPPRLTLELRDGSRVVGESVAEKIKFHSALLGDLKLAVKDIHAVDYSGTNAAKLTTANGDTLAVSFLEKTISIRTSFGKVEPAVENIRSIRVSSSRARAALRFNLNNRVEIPNDPQLQFGDGPFTIACWFKTESDRPYIGFISKRANALGDGWVLHQDHGQLLFYCAGCCSPKSQMVNVRDGQWHHVLISRANGQLTFYLDGQNVGSGEDRCQHFDGNSIRFGMDGVGEAWHFIGELSEIHFYNRALSALEAGEEWNSGQGIDRAVAGGGLIAGYHLNEGQGSVAKDFSGNHHDGTLINAPEWVN